MELINANGAIVFGGDRINRGLKYGDGFFETCRVYRGNILFLDAHLLRMARAMATLQLTPPSSWKSNFWQQQSRALWEATGRIEHGRLRITIFRSGKGDYFSSGHQPEFLMELCALEGFYQVGSPLQRIGIYKGMRKDFSSLSAVKSLAAQPYVLASLYAARRGWQDALLLNSKQQVVEATRANVFLLCGRRFVTPPIASGCVAGIFRKLVMRYLYKKGFAVVQKPLQEQDLMKADELFLTNVIQGIIPVSRLGRRHYAIHQTTQLAHQLYGQLAYVLKK